MNQLRPLPVTLNAAPHVRRGPLRSLLGSYLLTMDGEQMVAEVRAWQKLRARNKLAGGVLIPSLAISLRYSPAAQPVEALAVVVATLALVGGVWLLMLAGLELARKRFADELMRPASWEVAGRD